MELLIILFCIIFVFYIIYIKVNRFRVRDQNASFTLSSDEDEQPLEDQLEIAQVYGIFE